MHHAVRIILSVALAAVVCAQTDSSGAERPTIGQLARENEAAFQERDREQQEAAEWTERRFLNLARQFVRAWNDFVRDYDSGIYDARKASKLARAFHQLERAAGWVHADQDANASHSRRPADTQ